MQKGSTHSAATRRKMSSSARGKTKSPAHREAIGRASEGRAKSAASRAVISQKLSGREQSEQARDAISKGLTGNKNRQTHGMTDTPTYRSWRSMRDRCTRPATNGYERYGGAGIRVCERWSSFENFLADMGERPNGLTLDRMDSSGNYEPGNCRWATPKEQARSNRRYAVLAQDQEDVIRKRYAVGGVRQVDLAVEFATTQTRVSKIIRAS